MAQIVSDIHLEFFSKLPDYFNDEFVKSPFLFCAGDIGIPLDDPKGIWKNFILWADSNYQKVFYVLGNHENYGSKYETTMNFVESFFKDYTKNCVLLKKGVKDSITVKGKRYTVVGCTLWSNVDYFASEFLNDTKMIMDKIMPITYEKIGAWHKDEKDWLQNALEESDKPVIVMTHHLPSYELIHPDYQSPRFQKYNSGFASHCDELISQSTVWLFGHSHKPMSTTLKGCVCYSNPLGYKGEGDTEEFIRLSQFSFT